MDVILLLLGVAVVIFLWIALMDTTRFETTEYVVTDPRIRKDFRAVVLADLHNKQFGRENEVLLQAIEDGKPDLVLIAGDMLTAKPGKDFQVALDLTGRLAEKYPVCYGMGNHEHRLCLYRNVYGDAGRRYEKALKELGVRQMHNERRIFDDYGITVVGAQIHHRYYQRRHKNPMKGSYLERTLGAPDAERFTVLLAHNPDYFPEYASWGADLVLSGHVHGGVVRIPFWNKGLISPSMRFFPKYDGGLFEEGNSRMILSRGLGCHTIPVRLFNPGDLIFLTFQPGKETSIGKRTAISKGENKKTTRKKNRDMIK